LRILLSALEHSSNNYIQKVAEKLENVEFSGIYDFGDKKGMFSPSDFAVMGFVDTIKKLPLIKKSLNKMCDEASKCDCVLLSDSSSYNIPLAKKIKKEYPNKPIYYYILPQAWAWKSWRAKDIDRYCDRALATLPFEISLYNKAHFVGHPLLDIVTTRYEALGEEVAFLPGSRVGEIKTLMPIFRAVSKSLGKKSRLIIPKYFQHRVGEIYGDVSGFEISYSMEEGLKNVCFAYVCSGSATLEVALYGVPLVLAYRAKKIDYFIAKNLVKLDYIGLSNIFSQKAGLGELHPEFVQNDLTQESLIKAFDSFDRDGFIKKSDFLRSYLKHGSSSEVANIIKEELAWR